MGEAGGVRGAIEKPGDYGPWKLRGESISGRKGVIYQANAFETSESIDLSTGLITGPWGLWKVIRMDSREDRRKEWDSRDNYLQSLSFS